jgi:hypothetical protein
VRRRLVQAGANHGREDELDNLGFRAAPHVAAAVALALFAGGFLRLRRRAGALRGRLAGAVVLARGRARNAAPHLTARPGRRRQPRSSSSASPLAATRLHGGDAGVCARTRRDAGSDTAPVSRIRRAKRVPIRDQSRTRSAPCRARDDWRAGGLARIVLRFPTAGPTAGVSVEDGSARHARLGVAAGHTGTINRRPSRPPRVQASLISESEPMRSTMVSAAASPAVIWSWPRAARGNT